MATYVSMESVACAVHYDPVAGLFTWKHRYDLPAQWNARFSGKRAFGTKNSDGYLLGTINKKKLYAHRAAWAIYYGEWPDFDIDHINGNKTDNRIENLRPSDKSTNGMNRGAQRNNKLGVKGVHFDNSRGKWFAQIQSGGNRIRLGRFSSLGAAKSAYNNAAHEMHGEFMRP